MHTALPCVPDVTITRPMFGERNAYSYLACIAAFFVCDFGFSMHDTEMSLPDTAAQSQRARKVSTPNHPVPNVEQATATFGSPEGNIPCRRGIVRMPTTPKAAWVALIAGTGCQLPA